jgi:hypothetical protein
MCVCGGSADLRESVLFIGTQFSILYTFMYSPLVGWGSSAHALQVFLGKWCLFWAPFSAPFCPRGGEESEWSVDEWNALPLVDGESPGLDRVIRLHSQCIQQHSASSSVGHSRGLGWRIHGSVEDTKLSTNKQHSLSLMGLLYCSVKLWELTAVALKCGELVHGTSANVYNNSGIYRFPSEAQSQYLTQANLGR